MNDPLAGARCHVPLREMILDPCFRGDDMLDGFGDEGQYAE